MNKYSMLLCSSVILAGLASFADFVAAPTINSASDLKTRLLEIGRSGRTVYAWSTHERNWTEPGWRQFRDATGHEPLLYFAEFRGLGGTWRPRAYYETCRTNFAATAKRLWRERRAVPLVTWHIQNPYIPVMWKDPNYGSDCGMRYRSGCKDYPEEHRNVLREIVNGTGGACGFGRIDGRNEKTFPNPRAWFEWVLTDLAAFCRTLVDDEGRRIPIVWRPFHEMDGGWFWWGQGHAEPQDLIAAYRLFVDIMRRELGRDNMLVCYSPDRRWEGLGKAGESGFLTWYPGHDYADFIGWDDYGIGAGDTENDRRANAQKTLERMRIVTRFAQESGKVCGIWESGNRMFGAKAQDRPGFYRTLHDLATAPGVAFSVMTTYDGPCTFPNTDAGKREMAEFLSSPDVFIDSWNGKEHPVPHTPGAPGAVFGAPRAVPGGAGRGMALALEGKTLYAGLDGRVAVFDVSAPLAPRKLGEVDGLGGVRQLVAQNGFVYATARESGFWIVDATDPAHPRIRSRFDTCELATGVDVAGTVAFVGQRQNGVEFIDVSDPDHPAHIAMRQTDESQSVIYRDGFLYSGDWGTGHITVFDARDMRAIRQVAYEPLWGFGDGVWKKGRFLYAATGHHSRNRDVKTLPFKPVVNEDARTFGLQPGSGCGHGLDIFDVTDPVHPRRMGRADFPPLFVRGLDMWTPRTSANSEMVFCAQTHNGLFAVDCTDKARPRVADRWCFPEPKHPEWPSTCLGSVAVGDGCVYVVGQACGLRVIPARGAAAETVAKGVPPAHPEFREPYPTDARDFHVWKADRPGQARAVALRGDIVYAACGDAGLHVLQIRPEGGFAHLGALPNASTVFDVQVEGNRLYTAEGLAGWACYELTGPASFREVQRRAWYDKSHDPALCVWKPAPDRIVLSTRRNGANVFAIDDWTGPKSRVLARASNCPGWDKYLMDAPIGGGRWLAYNSAHHWITWIDLIDNKTVKTSTANRTSLSCGLCRLTDDLALMTRDGGYCLLRPGELDPPGGGAWPLHTFPGRRMSGMPRASKGGRLVLTNRINREIGLWDFADVDHPKFIRHWKVSGNPDLAVFHNEKFIVPCGHQGVLLQK